MKEFGTAAILCGGKSKRMGFDKSGIKIKNKFLIEIIAEELEQVFENIILISNDKEKFSAIKYNVVQDIIPSSGPAGGIYTALSHADSKYVFVIACDMPRINLNYIRYMMDIIKENKFDGVAAFGNHGKIEPLYAFYSTDMLSSFKNELEKNNFRILDTMRHCNIHYVEAEKVREYCEDLSIFTNLNYKSDLVFLEKVFNRQ
jgi:molybdenum cofactor guanylyltransferase